MFWKDIYQVLTSLFDLASGYILSTEKRTSILYLFTSFVFAYIVYKSNQSKRGFISYFLSKKVWLGTSALVDYSIILTNIFVKIILITPFLFLGLQIQMEINDLLVSIFGVSEFEISKTVVVLFYTILIWIFRDLSTYIVHYLFHRIPFLWEFHKIHHSATTMNPFTLYRIHPVELIINNLKSLFVYGLVTGVFYYLASGEVGTLTFVGVNIFTFLFMFFGANLRHSHVKLKFYNWVENIFISPFQHQIHHSDNPKHFNKNLGSHLAIWDKLFGTLLKSDEVQKIKFGLGKDEVENYNSLLKSIISPFKNLFKF